MKECSELRGFIDLAGAAPARLVSPKVVPEMVAMIPAIEQALAGAVDETARQTIVAGLWLRAGDLDRGHTICQDLPTSLGSAWHAVMHRREGDFSNAKYWWRQTRIAWPASLAEEVKAVLPAIGDTSAFVRAVAAGRYHAAEFVDAVEAGCAGGGTWPAVLEKIQELEWMALMRMSLAEAGLE